MTGLESLRENRKRNRRSPFDFAQGRLSTALPPDFLSSLAALANFMRLSLRKAAHVAVGEYCVVGNPGTLRSG